MSGDKANNGIIQDKNQWPHLGTKGHSLQPLSAFHTKGFGMIKAFSDQKMQLPWQQVTAKCLHSNLT